MNRFRNVLVLAIGACITSGCVKSDLGERLARKHAQQEAKNEQTQKTNTGKKETGYCTGTSCSYASESVVYTCLNADTFEFEHRADVSEDPTNGVLPLCPETPSKTDDKPKNGKIVPNPAAIMEYGPVYHRGRGLEMLL